MATVTESVKDTLVGSSKPAEMTTEVRASWTQFAKTDENGERYMDPEAFVNAIAPPEEDYHKIPREQYGVLFLVADRKRAGRITQSEYAAFQNILNKPDAPEYLMVFRLFDVNNTGTVNVDDLQRIYDELRGKEGLPFDFNGPWASLYFGAKGSRHAMTYEQFAQMLRGLQGERIRQAFSHYDSDHDGMITPDDFAHIIRENQGHKLSDHILENLPTLCNIQNGANISYPVIRAFLNITREMDLLDLIIRNATRKSSDGRIDKKNFLEEAQRVTRWSQFTPLEAEILFHFAGIDNPSGRLAITDFTKVLDASYQVGPRLDGFSDKTQEAASGLTSFLHGAVKSAHKFVLGSISGAFGAAVVYPIDLVKTRMQNQRAVGPGQKMYNNSIDCFRKIIRNEGFRGLYAGLPPQLVGVAPEKAIKLTTNEMLRARFTDLKTGRITVPFEMLAGGTAGACQVIFTNPLEIVKIRLQVQGELAKRSDATVTKRSAMWIVKNLGVMGLYKGAAACLLRDVPFSMIYFPTYAHMKTDVFGDGINGKQIGIAQLIIAGAVAGIPAAYLTTPADVIKTRLQVEARKGDATYKGIVDCFRQVMKSEGPKAFFKGGPARVLRSSPQFGCTLAAFEVLKKNVPLPARFDPEAAAEADLRGALEPGIGLREASSPFRNLVSRNTLRLMKDIDKDLGLRWGGVAVPSILKKN